MEVILLGYFILIPIILLFITYVYCSYKLNYWKRRGVKQLKSTNKIFGNFKNAFLFRTAPGYHIGDLYREAPVDAPCVGFYIFHRPCLLLKDPKLIKQMMVRDFSNFSNRYFAGVQQKDSVGMRNLFGLKNPAWRYLRKKMTPTFSRNKMKQMLTLMIETGKPMMDYLKKNIGDDKAKVIDAQDINYKYAADLIANVALGTKTDSFNYPDSAYSKSIHFFFHSFRRMVALFTVFFIPEVVNIIGDPIFLDFSIVHKIFWDAIKSRQESGVKRGDFIDSIIDLKNGEQDPIYKFEGDNLVYQSGTFFSGFESSSITSTFTLMELAKEKSYQDRAREDIKSAIEEHGWTIEAFNKMKFLGQCIAEGMRMNPSVSHLNRETLQDYKIRDTDIIVEKGTPIFISLYGLHGDPQFFDEPEVFNPERFSDDKIISDAYIPFGVGPKKCIGMPQGELYVKVVLSMILSEYEVYQKPTVENKLNSRSTFTMLADGLNIEFTKLN